MFLMTNDVRCDTILTACVVTSVWWLQEWVVSRKSKWFFAACLAIAVGMMTKGPIALMIPAFCFVSNWILKREWRNMFRPIYLPGLIIIAVLLVPMSIGLYQQFDLHPEKIVNGKQGVSGLRFFFWSQSFGRITGESPWKNDVNIWFLLQNMLWSFLPWIVLFVLAMAVNFVSLVRQVWLPAAAAARMDFHWRIPAYIHCTRLLRIPVAALYFCCLSIGCHRYGALHL